MYGTGETNEAGETGAMGWPDERDGTRAAAGPLRGGPEHPAHRRAARHGR